MENHARELTTDELLELVANQTRRVVLRQLVEAEDGRAGVEELVSTVCATRSPTVGKQPTSHEATRTRLHHRHLPKLAGAGVVEYAEDCSRVRYHSNERLEALLDFIDEEL